MHGLKRAISTNLFHRIYRLLTGESMEDQSGSNGSASETACTLLTASTMDYLLDFQSQRLYFELSYSSLF